MGLNILERIKMPKKESEVIFRTVKNGRLTVLNVPHTLYPGGQGPDGEKDYVTADVMYQLSKIFRYMLDNRIVEMDYNNF